MKAVKLNRWYKRLYNAIIHIIANNDLPLNLCIQLDKMLSDLQRGIEKHEGIDPMTQAHCYRILSADGLVTYIMQTGYAVTSYQAKFNGYVAGFRRKLYGNIARGIWNLLTAVLIPLAVAYWTVKLTLPIPH